MSLGDTMVSGKVTHVRTKIVWFHFYEISSHQIHRDRKQNGNRWGRREEWELLLDYRVLKTFGNDRATVAQHCECN